MCSTCVCVCVQCMIMSCQRSVLTLLALSSNLINLVLIAVSSSGDCCNALIAINGLVSLAFIVWSICELLIIVLFVCVFVSIFCVYFAVFIRFLSLSLSLSLSPLYLFSLTLTLALSLSLSPLAYISYFIFFVYIDTGSSPRPGLKMESQTSPPGPPPPPPSIIISNEDNDEDTFKPHYVTVSSQTDTRSSSPPPPPPLPRTLSVNLGTQTEFKDLQTPDSVCSMDSFSSSSHLQQRLEAMTISHELLQSSLDNAKRQISNLEATVERQREEITSKESQLSVISSRVSTLMKSFEVIVTCNGVLFTYLSSLTPLSLWII